MILLRYIINGLVATGIHYTALYVCIEIIGFNSVGFANSVAALFGIVFSYLGNRYFVFKRINERMFSQAMKFGSLYFVIAILHGVFLAAWSDWQGYSYNTGFILATCLQFLLSFIGNNVLVFKK